MAVLLVELGVVIGKNGRNISPSTAFDHVAGYCEFYLSYEVPAVPRRYS